MTARDNILLVLEQYAAADERAPSASDGSKFSMCTEDGIANLLKEIDWSRIPAEKVREIFEFALARLDIRSVARMSGVANAERETLRGVLAEMKADGHEVVDVDAVTNTSGTNARKVA